MASMIEVVSAAVASLVVTITGFLFKKQLDKTNELREDILRLEDQVDDIDARLTDAVNERQVRRIIEDKLKPLEAKIDGLNVRFQDHQDNLVRMEAKIDRLLEK